MLKSRKKDQGQIKQRKIKMFQESILTRLFSK